MSRAHRAHLVGNHVQHANGILPAAQLAVNVYQGVVRHYIRAQAVDLAQQKTKHCWSAATYKTCYMSQLRVQCLPQLAFACRHLLSWYRQRKLKQLLKHHLYIWSEWHLQLVEDVEGQLQLTALDGDVHEGGVGVGVAGSAARAHLPHQPQRMPQRLPLPAKRYCCTRTTVLNKPASNLVVYMVDTKSANLRARAIGRAHSVPAATPWASNWSAVWDLVLLGSGALRPNVIDVQAPERVVQKEERVAGGDQGR